MVASPMPEKPVPMMSTSTSACAIGRAGDPVLASMRACVPSGMSCSELMTRWRRLGIFKERVDQRKELRWPFVDDTMTGDDFGVASVIDSAKEHARVPHRRHDVLGTPDNERRRSDLAEQVGDRNGPVEAHLCGAVGPVPHAGDQLL